MNHGVWYVAIANGIFFFNAELEKEIFDYWFIIIISNGSCNSTGSNSSSFSGCRVIVRLRYACLSFLVLNYFAMGLQYIHENVYVKNSGINLFLPSFSLCLPFFPPYCIELASYSCSAIHFLFFFLDEKHIVLSYN